MIAPHALDGSADQDSLERLVADLGAAETCRLVNPYADHDPELDRPDGAAIRRANLLAYLEERRSPALLLVGERPLATEAAGSLASPSPPSGRYRPSDGVRCVHLAGKSSRRRSFTVSWVSSGSSRERSSGTLSHSTLRSMVSLLATALLRRPSERPERFGCRGSSD